MNGVLVLAHGSRVQKTQDTLNAIVGMVREKLPDQIIEVAYMELCDITIEKGIEILHNKGVRNVKVVPYFLFDGIHIKKDIPGELENIGKKYPDMKITMGQTLGMDSRLADILVDRILV